MKFLSLFLCAMSATALDNSVTVHNNFTGAMVNHPITKGLWLAQGEVTDFPRAYLTPSDTGIRAPATEWQATVKNRWRDSTASRTITGVRTAAPCWNSGATGGCGTLTSIVVSGDVATMTTGSAHNLEFGHRLMIGITPADLDLIRDNYSVHEVTSATVVKFLVRSVTAATYTTGFTVKRPIDPIAPDNCTYVSDGHGFYKGEILTSIAGITGMTGANSTTPLTIVGVSRNEFVTTQTCTGTFGGTATATGPDNGSVRFALIAVKATIPANGSTRIDFVNDPNPSSAGDEAATIAAGYSKTEMLAASWGAEFVATANVKAGATASFTTSARDMLTAWNGTESYCGPRYWAIGPVLTELILRYECPASIGETISDDIAWQGANPANFGWKIVPGSTITQNITTIGQTQFTVADATNIAIGARLWFISGSNSAEVMEVTNVAGSTVTVLRGREGSQAATSYTMGTCGTCFDEFGILQWQNAGSDYDKSITPGFTLKFIPGQGVGVRVELSNTSYTRMQSLWYTPTLKAGSTPTTRLTLSRTVPWSGTPATELKHPNRSSWSWSVWDGEDPEHYCKGLIGGTDPNRCADTGGGTRALKYRIDHNTPYLIYAKAFPQYRLYSGVTSSAWNKYPPALTKGFDFSDKGAVGVVRNFGTAQSWPGLYLGSATYGAQFNATNEALFLDSAQEEGGFLESEQALFVQSWDFDGYEYNFGVSVPGGGGATEVEHHITEHLTDDDSTYPRPFYFGFNDLSYSRPINLASRPGWDSREDRFSSVLAIDAPATACSSSASPVTMNSAQSSTWPCYHTTNVLGRDKWGVATAHQNDRNYLAYLMTGDWWYLKAENQKTAFMTGYPNWTFPKANNHSWAIHSNAGSSYNPRTSTWQQRAVIRSFLLTPNVPQFGASVPSGEVHYYNYQLWNQAYGEEGYADVRDGMFAAHYPAQFPHNCGTYTPTSVGMASGTSWSNATAASRADPSPWRYTRCGLLDDEPNALGYATTVWGNSGGSNCAPGEPYISCNDVANDNLGAGPATYQTTYAVDLWSAFEEQGFNHFYAIRRKYSTLLINLVSNVNTNGYLTATYQSPGRSETPDQRWHQTIAAVYGGYATSWPYQPGGVTMTKAGLNTFNYLNKYSTTSTVTYVQQVFGALSFMKGLSGASLAGCTAADVPPAGCTGDLAYEWYAARATLSDTLMKGNPKVAFKPRENISNLLITPTATAALITYTKPTTDICTYRVSTVAPQDSLDTDDTSDGSAGLGTGSISLTGLATGSTYHLRLTCGTRLTPFATTGAVTGTGRAYASWGTGVAPPTFLGTATGSSVIK